MNVGHCYRRVGFGHAAIVVALAVFTSLLRLQSAEGQAEPTTRSLALEYFVDMGKPAEAEAAEQLKKSVADQEGLVLRIVDVREEAGRERLTAVCRHFRHKEQTPLLYGAGQIAKEAGSAREWQQRLDDLRTLTVYVRAGCPRCAKGKEYVAALKKSYPGLKVRLRDIAADAAANRDLQKLVAKHRVTAVSVPVFHLCDQLIVGFLDARSSGGRIEGVLARWTVPDSKQKSATKPAAAMKPGAAANFWALLFLHPGVADAEFEEPADSLPLGPPDDESFPALTESDFPADEIELPVLGRVRATALGLPLFTIAVGLVDGFNPCAMWVLLFLLSVLVNLHSRWKILAVAGTFVVISAAAYFAFMAAWISVFQFIGMTRVVQISLACAAIAIGVIHIKDFFAFKQGISLSIPESAKPGIYERVRRIVTAENLTGAILGAAALAVMVNMVELLCTAGLPALYTQILAAQQLPAWQNYAYLGLYDLAYMFDDTLMVALVVITLGRRKMQERHGRWLKLVSGSAIVLLGVTMLLRPDWLGM